MRPEKRRHQLERPFGVQPGDALEALQLVGEAEAIAALHFDGRDAEAEEALEPPSRELLELILAGSADADDCRVDAAARRGDLLIGAALQPLFKLALAATGPDEVRVAIDKAGEDGFAAGIDDFGGAGKRRQLRRRPQPRDLPVVGDDGCVGDSPKLPHRVAARRRAGRPDARDELASVADNKTRSDGHRRSPLRTWRHYTALEK